MGFRVDTRNAFKTGLDAFAAANPSLVDNAFKARPPSLAEQKGIFISGIAEPRILHSAGVRQRDIEVSAVCWVQLSDNEETTDKLESMVDALMDYLTDNPHVISGYTVQQPIRVTPIELDEGGVIVPAIAITCVAQIQEGRG